MAANKGKSDKVKNGQLELAVNDIDNTAPITDIMKEMYARKCHDKMYSFYSHNVKQFAKRARADDSNEAYHYMIPGYPFKRFPDDWDGTFSKDYFEEFMYKSTMPKMITPLQNYDSCDPVTESIQQKMDWKRKCEYLKTHFLIHKLLDRYEKLNEEVVQCPKQFVKFAKLLDSDPDPYYESYTYNWLYAGNGNMQLICIDWIDYLLHSEFTCLHLRRFYKDNMTVKNECETYFDCGEGNNICETVACRSGNIVAVRTKYNIFILKIIITDDKMEFVKLKETNSEMPFTGISFDSFHTNILYISSLDDNLTIVNIDRMKGRSLKMTNKRKSKVDNWNAVIGIERTYFCHVSKEAVSIYDKRSNSIQYTFDSTRDMTDFKRCNEISAAKQFEGTSLLYFATDHHLFLMDLRSSAKNTNKPKAVQRWTHGMQCVPTYLSMCPFEFNKQLICLSSQWCEDMCIIQDYIDKNDTLGVTIPFRPPSIMEALTQARQKMLCFDIYSPLERRISASITGCLLFEYGEKYVTLMQNSFGDISRHTLYPEHLELFIDDDSIESLEEWRKSYKLPKKVFEVSTIKNMGKVLKSLKRIPEGYKIGEGEYAFNCKVPKFDEGEMLAMFEKEEIDSGLLDAWMQDGTDVNQTSVAVDHTSSAMNLHYSDDSD